MAAFRKNTISERNKWDLKVGFPDENRIVGACVSVLVQVSMSVSPHSLLEVLSEHLNAEVVAGTIGSKQDAMDYITWTYFFRRLLRNPRSVPGLLYSQCAIFYNFFLSVSAMFSMLSVCIMLYYHSLCECHVSVCSWSPCECHVCYAPCIHGLCVSAMFVMTLVFLDSV